ncbi:MAG: manganese efflux pump, partial [bacterium]
FLNLLILAIATSIDALAVGVSFAFLDISITIPVIIIGCVAFIFSFVGVELGNRLGCYAKSRAEVLGGLILIVLGVKILLEHLYF